MTDDLIAGQYADRPGLRPVLDAVLALLPAIGDVTVEPRRTCVSLASSRRVFASIQPTTRSRLDLGLRLDAKPGGRLLVAKNIGSGTINLRIPLTSADEVDNEVVEWLAEAYRQSTVPPARKPRAPRRQLANLTPMSVLIEGHDLPGLSCAPGPEGEHNAVHVGFWTSAKDQPGVHVPGKPGVVTDITPGDAPAARWECTVTVGQDEDGLDFVGHRVRGVRGDRHLGLIWGDFDGCELHMFRGAKLRLVDVDPDIIAAATRPGHRLVGRLGLTDEKGHPVCARRNDIVWTAEPS